MVDDHQLDLSGSDQLQQAWPRARGDVEPNVRDGFEELGENRREKVHMASV